MLYFINKANCERNAEIFHKTLLILPILLLCHHNDRSRPLFSERIFAREGARWPTSRFYFHSEDKREEESSFRGRFTNASEPDEQSERRRRRERQVPSRICVTLKLTAFPAASSGFRGASADDVHKVVASFRPPPPASLPSKYTVFRQFGVFLERTSSYS